MITLAIAFSVTAMLYAAIGFGGGSTYNALLVLMDTDYRILPSIALLCNLIVVSSGTYNFARTGHIEFRRIWPWIITSVPTAWIGSSFNISKIMFSGILGFSLLAASVRMLWTADIKIDVSKSIINQYRFLPPVIGTLLGLLAGLVGIGGGIFLAPILYLLRWDNEKKIAAACSLFILLNSIAGLTGQMMKFSNTDVLAGIAAHWMLFPAVLLGGQISSYVRSTCINPKIIRYLTAILMLYAAGGLLWQWGKMLT